MAIEVTSIPGIMSRKSWLNGARLMEIWLSRPSATAPVYSAPVTDTIKMASWVLTFGRAKAVYDQLMRERVWANAPARAEIVKILRAKGLLVPSPNQLYLVT